MSEVGMLRDRLAATTQKSKDIACLCLCHKLLIRPLIGGESSPALAIYAQKVQYLQVSPFSRVSTVKRPRGDRENQAAAFR